MDHNIRLLVVLAFFALSLYRFIRAHRARPDKRSAPERLRADGLRPRAAPAPPAPIAPPSGDPIALPGAPGPAEVPGSIAGAGFEPGGSSRIATLAAVVAWLAPNAVVWLALFELPALENIPVSWRVATGIVASVLLIAFARAVGARFRARPDSSFPGGNPFPDS
jgi:hypothetical protein